MRSTVAHGINAGVWGTRPYCLALRAIVGLLSGHLHDAAVGLDEPTDHTEQRRLSAARRTEQAHEFASSDVEVDRPQCLDDLSTAAEDLVDAPHRHVEVGARHGDAPGSVVHVHGVVHDV